MNFGKIFQGRFKLIEGDTSKKKLSKLFFFPVKQIKQRIVIINEKKIFQWSTASFSRFISVIISSTLFSADFNCILSTFTLFSVYCTLFFYRILVSQMTYIQSIQLALMVYYQLDTLIDVCIRYQCSNIGLQPPSPETLKANICLWS